MRELQFWQIDSFSAEPYRGNPAAVVFDADGLTAEEMQTIARQMNLSETVFLCRPTGEASYRARIFTPGMEIPFAGHPTIAAAFAHASTRQEDGAIRPAVLRQECGAGIIPIAVTDAGGVLFTLESRAEPAIGTRLGRPRIASLLGLAPEDVAADPAEVCSIGLPWLIARIESAQVLQGARADLRAIGDTCREHRAVGLTVYALGAFLEGCDLHVRTFAPGVGITEDPVCGSGNGSVAVHLARHRYRDRERFSYVAEQGLEVHRRGRLHLAVERAGGGDSVITVRLGGQAVKVLEGRLWI